MQPRWEEFENAILLYRKRFDTDDLYRNFSYQDFINSPLVQQLRTNPGEVPFNEIENQVISGFLNRWGRCRIGEAQRVATSIQTEVQNLVPYLQPLNAFTIETPINFDQNLTVQGNQLTIGNAVEQCYMRLKGINGIGPTATSKLLHILHPNYFVMWDTGIRRHYRFADNAAEYVRFLQTQNEIVMQLCESFKNAKLEPPARANQGPADYLSERMDYNPPKTFAKYIDEYNWINMQVS